MLKRRYSDDPYDTAELFVDENCCRSDIVINKKEQRIRDLCERKNHYKKFCSRQTLEIDKMVVIMAEKDKEVARLMTLLGEKDRQMAVQQAEFTRRSKGMMEEYVGHWSAREVELQDELGQLRNENQALQSDLSEVKRHYECQQRVGEQKDEEVNRLKEASNQLNEEIERLRQRVAEMESDDIEEIRDNLIAKESELKTKNKKIEDLKKKYESLSEKYQKKKKDKKELEAEQTVIKEQLKTAQRRVSYFKNKSEIKNKEFLGAVHTAVRQKEVYVNCIRRSVNDGIDETKELAKSIMEAVKQLLDRSVLKQKDRVAKNVLDNKDKMEKIEDQVKRMSIKRSDKKYNCPECENAFANLGRLSFHMTVQHKINIKDWHRSRVEMIEID